MAHTAMNEALGGGITEVISADTPVRPPTRLGGARLIVYYASSSGLTVTLPDATTLQPGGRLHYLLCLAGTSPNNLTVDDNEGGFLNTLTPGDCVEMYLVGNATAAGEWTRPTGTFEQGGNLSRSRQPIDLDLDIGLDLDVKTIVQQRQLWDGTSPVGLRVTLGVNAVVGSDGGSSYGLTVTGFPAGSTLLLVVSTGAYITGKGGNGGRGSGANVAQPGLDGGHALGLGIHTVSFNYGTIQGGGGGGGGGAQLGGVPGGGGGGGAGYLGGEGGPAGGSGATAGVAGQLTIAGGGGTGHQSGGTGGLPGAAGSTAGAAGGAAGDYARYLNTVTFTEAVAGTTKGSSTSVGTL